MNSEVKNILIAARELKAPLIQLRQLALTLDFTEQQSAALTPVIPGLETPKSAKSPKSARAHAELYRQMVDISDRAIRQVNDLTKLPQLEANAFAIEPVCIRELCDAVAADLGETFRFNRRELQKSYRNRARLVNTNRDLFYSVIYNFCLNALPCSEAGAPSLLTLSDHSDKVRVSVRDFGPALPTPLWRKIQTGQLQSLAAIPMRPGSSSLGFYIASQFADYLGAHLGATRHRDGTTFYVDLPVSHQLSFDFMQGASV